MDRELIGGREARQIVVVAYDERWPSIYDRMAARVRRALGSRVLTLEHIGSTAVPGLVAKPVVDALLTVQDVGDEPAYLPALESVGLALRVREAGHRMVRTPERDFHLHVYEPDAPAVRDHLAFRDRLRESAEDRALYARTKLRLAERQWRDMNEYADAKTDVIAAVLRAAPPRWT